MPAMNATTPAKNSLTLVGVPGHVGEGSIVLIEGSDFGDTEHCRWRL
jgi:hypothetical protein